MKRLRLAAAWAAVGTALALAALLPAAGPLREEALRERYGGWAGVLRLWVFEGWASGGGSLRPWLEEAVAAFEKAHRGAYVQLTETSEAALRDSAGADNPPDMIIFPPGLLETPGGLLALPESAGLRAGLEACGLWKAERRALPVAMGAYTLVYNRAALEGLPVDWRGLAGEPRGCRFWLDWPADSAYLHWSRAMDDLLAPAVEAPAAPRAGEGLDLGLPAAAEAALPRLLPEDFGQSASVYRAFVSGAIAAMPATQREIRRLQLLSEAGRAPDWAAARASAYTDQLALLAVTDSPRPDSAARQALCLEFAALLLEPGTQAKLTRAGAFPVIDLPPLYGGSEGMAQMEAALSAIALRPEPAFSGA